METLVMLGNRNISSSCNKEGHTCSTLASAREKQRNWRCKSLGAAATSTSTALCEKCMLPSQHVRRRWLERLQRFLPRFLQGNVVACSCSKWIGMPSDVPPRGAEVYLAIYSRSVGDQACPMAGSTGGCVLCQLDSESGSFTAI